MSFISRVASWFAGLFRKAEAPKRQAKKRHEKEHFGAHYYLSDLLDKIDTAFSDMAALKKADRDAHDLFVRLGATVASKDMLFINQLDSHIVKTVPAFGCFHAGGANTEKQLGGRMAYFIKETSPQNVQLTNHTIYRCGIVYEDGGTFVGTWYVAVSPDGDVYPLRQRYKEYFPDARLHRFVVGYPPALQQWAADHGCSVEQQTTEAFAIMANAAAARNSGLTIRVRKGRKSVAFAIDMERTPYFFKDREKTVTESGSTKKIFHIVRGHWRGERFIKPHFRGLRHFTWNGYKVSIGLAGKHGAALGDFNLATTDNPELGETYVDAEYMAERLDEVTV